MAQTLSFRELAPGNIVATLQDMKTQFLTNAKGKVISAVVPIKAYEEMLEDLEDLAACLEVRDEETIPWEQVKKEIFGDAILSD